MSNLDKLNRLRSLYERNRLVSNANELISASIKKQLNEIDHSSYSNSDVSSQNNNIGAENHTSNSGDYQTSSSSYDSEDEESGYDQSEPDSIGSDSYNDDSAQYDKFSDLDDPKTSLETKSQLPEASNNRYDQFCKDVPLVESSKGEHQCGSDPKNVSKTGLGDEYLKNVFLNLENNLSKVRLGYQASLSNRSLDSSIFKKDLRRSQSICSLKSNRDICATTSSSQANNVKPTSSLSRFYSNSSNKHTRSSSLSNLSINDSNKQNNFNLNKWFDDLPPGLKNFVELQSSNSSVDRNNSIRNVSINDKNINVYNNNNINVYNNNNNMNNNRFESNNKTQFEEMKSSNNVPSSNGINTLGSTENIPESQANREKQSNNSHDLVSSELEQREGGGGYLDKFKSELITPIKDMFSEDFKDDLKDEIMYFKEDLINLKDGIVDLYNKSPKVLRNLIKQEDSESELNDNEKIEKKLLVNPNSYYLQSERNSNSIVSNYLENEDEKLFKTGSLTREGSTHTDKLKNRCKVFNIYDKYECFDISDQTKLTHVSSFDINNPNQGYSMTPEVDDSDEEEGKIVTSISDYNIEFLSNLSKVNEKCNMLNTHKISCNLIKPWFTNPINEKIQINSNRSKLSRSSRVKTDEKHEFNAENIKYVIKKGEDSVKYTIDNASKPNNTEDAKKGPINLYDIENYYNEVNYEYQNDEGKKFYDPISHFEKIRDGKKKTINNTEWAAFGRPLVKKNKQTTLK